ncbi:MAG: tRNA pseudouridine synthase A, partial [Desulfobacterales bacterium]|nr:tRNA pseudouridine synthase A [Desulfobacterales bacterium]
MQKNIKLTIEYDGTAYNGWQRQKNGRTIQEEIEKALRAMTGRKVTLTGAGRTDAGVHALGQVANFICDTRLEPEAFFKGLNSLLPGDIVIRKCVPVHEKFHSRYDAKSKVYNYRILNRLVPAAVGRDYAWHIRKPL